MEKRTWLILLFIWWIPAMASGQNLVWNDTLVLATLQNPSDQGASLVKFRLTQEMEYSLTGTSLIFYNWQQGNNASVASLVHHFKIRSQLTNAGDVKISNCIFHLLGIQYFFDSISRFQPDENTMDTRIEVRIGENLTFTVFSNITTRIFNSYCYAANQKGTLVKTLNTSFLTPFLWTLSAGFAWVFPQTGTLSIGLSAAKFTWIRDRTIFDRQNITGFYGVPKGKDHVFEYGFSMHLLVDKDFLKRIHWYCDLLIFKNPGKPFDLVMKNQIGIRINKFLKTSIQTRFYYENEVSKSIQMENMFSLGFYFNR